MTWTTFWQLFILIPWAAVWIGACIPSVRTVINKMQ